MRRRCIRGVGLIALLCSGLAATAAFAQQRPCAEYVKKFCPGMSPGTSAAMSCLAEHMADLSDACRQRVQSKAAINEGEYRGPAPQQALHACKSEIEKNCNEVAPGGGRIVKCLQEHEQDLGETCKAALPKSPE